MSQNPATSLPPAGTAAVLMRLADDTPLRDLADRTTASVDFLYCGGIVHRLSEAEGAHLVAECFRVLRPFGTLRIATLDLDRIVHAYLFDWAGEEDATASPTQRINAAFRQPGVRFLYGEEALRDLLARTGLVEILRFAPNASSDTRFCDLEADRLHSLVFQARKP